MQFPGVLYVRLSGEPQGSHSFIEVLLRILNRAIEESTGLSNDNHFSVGSASPPGRSTRGKEDVI